MTRIGGRAMEDYVLASKWFFAALLILSAISTMGRLTGHLSGFVMYFQFIAVPVIGWAGWRVVRKHGFSMMQTAIVGFILSFASHWTLPFFHSAAEMSLLLVVNSIIFVAVALGGGFLAKKTRIP